MSTHVPLGNASQIANRHRRTRLVLAALGAVCIALALLWLLMRSADDFGDTDVSQKTLSRAQQIALINSFSPLAIPSSASEIKVKYQRFQDWFFEASFVLPPRDFKTWTARLKPQARASIHSKALGDASAHLYAGKRIGAFTGSVRAQPQARRITIFHSSS